MNKFDILRQNDNFRQLINQNKSSYSDREFLTLKDKFNISSASLNNIEDLIYLGFQYDDEYIIPEYQRELVWTLEQKQSLIKSVLIGNPIGDFLFKEETNKKRDTFYYTVIDGQQRLNALREFAAGIIPLEDGRFLKDLTSWDGRNFFEYDTFVGIKIKGISINEEIEIYLQRNAGGTTHTQEEINLAKSFLK
jgi:hypothetical protein